MKAADLTHQLTAARPRTAAVALACALAMTSGLAVAACAGPQPGAASPSTGVSPSTAASSPQAVSPSTAASLSTAGSPVPASAIPQLTAIGRRAAAATGDTAPLWMTAVLTTHAKALTSATPGDFVPGDVPVFLITIRGNFVASGASRPAGATAPTGRYLSIVVDTRTFQVLDWGLSPSPPPVPPASLGPITHLAADPH